jgi:hypothetical protein
MRFTWPDPSFAVLRIDAAVLVSVVVVDIDDGGVFFPSFCCLGIDQDQTSRGSKAWGKYYPSLVISAITRTIFRLLTITISLCHYTYTTVHCIESMSFLMEWTG